MKFILLFFVSVCLGGYPAFARKVIPYDLAAAMPPDVAAAMPPVAAAMPPDVAAAMPPDVAAAMPPDVRRGYASPLKGS